MNNYIIFNSLTSKNNYEIKPIDKSIYNKLLSNEFHKKFNYSVSKNKIEEEFEIKIDDVGENVNIITMCELSEKQINNYLDIYADESDNLEEFVEYLSIVIYNQVPIYKFKLNKKFYNILENISSYWQDPYNCNYNLNDVFIKRRFGDIQINNKLDKNNLDKNNLNYLNDLLRENKFIETNFSKKYYLNKSYEISKDDFIEIYNYIPSEYLKYLFLTNLLCSRLYCHLILNNKEILELSKPIFDKFKLVFKYLLGYAWLTLRIEESLKLTKIKDNDRIVFDIDTVTKLPIYPYTYDDINQNPYACILLSSELINLKENCLSMDMNRNYEKYYGVCDSTEFSRRLNLFVNSSNTKGILEKIDWNHYAISGSAITACAMKYNPLIDICKTNDDFNFISDSDLNSYFFHYYLNSDIDLICNHESIYDFIDSVIEFVKNLEVLNNSNITIDNVHTATIVISEELIMYELDELKIIINNNLVDIEYIKNNINDQIIKNHFYDKYYLPWKKEIIEKNNNRNNKLYQDYFQNVSKEEFRIFLLNYEIDEDTNIKYDYEKYIYISDIINEPIKNKLIAKLSESIRYKVKAPNVRTFEIFKTKNSNFFSMISRFHMGFVRAYWNGTTVKCLPSFISSMMIPLASDYKYFSSVRDPIEIVNKYRSRGFGVILNDNEKLHMANYNCFKNNDNTNWINMYNVNIKIKSSIKSIFGSKKSSNDIFKLSKFFLNLTNDYYKDVFHDTISDFNECFNPIIIPCLSGISKYKAILDNGSIKPLEHEIIKLSWNLVNA